MSSMFCNQVYRCKNRTWCARNFDQKSDEPECFELLTNYDRLISKSPEELAAWLTFVEQRVLARNPMLKRPAMEKDWLYWLRQEAENDR